MKGRVGRWWDRPLWSGGQSVCVCHGREERESERERERERACGEEDRSAWSVNRGLEGPYLYRTRVKLESKFLPWVWVPLAECSTASLLL